MWQHILRSGDRPTLESGETEAQTGSSRRGYYRVEAWVPVRLTRLAPESVGAAVYDLSLPEPTAALTSLDGPERSALLARLRRIEDKLDLLLTAASIDVPRPLSGRDRRLIVFSGGGLSLDVDFECERGVSFRVELLLPAPYSRVVRAVAETVQASRRSAGGGSGRLGLAFRHISPAERDAIVGYSYDLQRVALRAKSHAAAAVPS
jgi:hypothetical protein